MIDKIRTYRNWVEDKDLVSFTARIGESDLFIRADKTPPLDPSLKRNRMVYPLGLKELGGSIPVDKPFHSQAQSRLRLFRQIIQDYIQKNPGFATTLKPYSLKDRAPDIIREMVEASSSAAVGPMAAVAGAIAEYVGKDLLKYSDEIIVENGGDIFMKTNRMRKVGIFAGRSSYTGRLALEIAPGDTWGICTSSGTVGPSLSFGQADAVVALCNSAILADAWATRLGNMVKSTSEVEEALSFVKDIPEIKGVVIIIGEKIGAYGDIKLAKVKP